MVGKIDFPASGKHFSSPFFRDSCQFFCLAEKYFSTKSFIPGGGNGFSGYWKPFWFAQSFSSVENVTEINGSQFLKKDHILTNEN